MCLYNVNLFFCLDSNIHFVIIVLIPQNPVNTPWACIRTKHKLDEPIFVRVCVGGRWGGGWGERGGLIFESKNLQFAIC